MGRVTVRMRPLHTILEFRDQGSGFRIQDLGFSVCVCICTLGDSQQSGENGKACNWMALSHTVHMQSTAR